MDNNSTHVVGLMWKANACGVMRIGSDPQSAEAVSRFAELANPSIPGFKLLGDSWHLGMQSLPPLIGG